MEAITSWLTRDVRGQGVSKRAGQPIRLGQRSARRLAAAHPARSPNTRPGPPPAPESKSPHRSAKAEGQALRCRKPGEAAVRSGWRLSRCSRFCPPRTKQRSLWRGQHDRVHRLKTPTVSAINHNRPPRAAQDASRASACRCLSESRAVGSVPTIATRRCHARREHQPHVSTPFVMAGGGRLLPLRGQRRSGHGGVARRAR